MTLQQRVRNWLGIDMALHDLERLRELRISDRNAIDRMRQQLDAIGPGIARVVAKVDAKFAETEFSPERREASDKLADEVIRRLEAEALARKPYND